MESMLPCDDLYLRSDATQRKSRDCPPNKMLNSCVEKAIAMLFESELEYQQQVEISKRDLIRRYDWTPLAAFNSIDV
jgi:hypothetical protein